MPAEPHAVPFIIAYTAIKVTKLLLPWKKDSSA